MAMGLCPLCNAEGRLLTYPGAKKLKCPTCGIIDLLALPAPPPPTTVESEREALHEVPVIYANGHVDGTVAVHEAPRAPNELVPDQIKYWHGILINGAMKALRTDKEFQQPVPVEVLLEKMTDHLIECADIMREGKAEGRPPDDMSQVEIREDCERMAKLAIEQWTNVRHWNSERALTSQDAPVSAEIAEFEKRLPVDAYAAYEAMRADSRDYSVEGLIRDGCTALLTGLIGSGKSTMAMNFARAWALGVPVLGRQCRQSKVLVVVSAKEFEAWTTNIGFWELKELIYIVESSKAHFNNAQLTVKWFDYCMEKFGCRTFVLDTLFDFFGMPPHNNGDSNRIGMNEQNPLLECVRQQNYSGLVLGHAPKSEAKAIDPRDPEESFGGHNAWSAQHRMRMVVRRKSAQAGVNAFITGKGGFGDRGVLKEEIVLFDEKTRIVTLGGLFSEHMGRAAMPEVVDAIGALGGGASIAKLVLSTGKPEKWIRAGVKLALQQKLLVKVGNGKNTRYVLASHNLDDPDAPVPGEEDPLE